MQLKDIIGEISSLRSQANHRSANEIVNYLQNNQRELSSRIDETALQGIIASFTSLAEANPRTTGKDAFKADYDKAFSLLSFYFERII